MEIKKVKKLLNTEGDLCNYEVTYNDDKVWCVPLKEDNTDYQNVLEWVADGNTIQEAD